MKGLLMPANHTRKFAVVCLFLSGCNAAGSGQSPDLFKATWSKLPDLSFFSEVGGEGDFEVAARCWQDEPADMRCIRISVMNAGGMKSTTVSLGREDALPDSLIPNPAHDGYSCNDVLGVNETISRDDQVLISNRPGMETSRWKRGFVDSYMKSNAVVGQPYFDCLGILQSIEEGSLATLSTTSVKRSMID